MKLYLGPEEEEILCHRLIQQKNNLINTSIADYCHGLCLCFSFSSLCLCFPSVSPALPYSLPDSCTHLATPLFSLWSWDTLSHPDYPHLPSFCQSRTHTLYCFFLQPRFVRSSAVSSVALVLLIHSLPGYQSFFPLYFVSRLVSLYELVWSGMSQQSSFCVIYFSAVLCRFPWHSLLFSAVFYCSTLLCSPLVFICPVPCHLSCATMWVVFGFRFVFLFAQFELLNVLALFHVVLFFALLLVLAFIPCFFVASVCS